jgi:hypothetical protein
VGLRELGRTMQVNRCYMFPNSWNETMKEHVCNQLLDLLKHSRANNSRNGITGVLLSPG